MDFDKRQNGGSGFRHSNDNAVSNGFNFKKYIPWVIVGVLVIWSISIYNGLVKAEEPLNEAWDNVETTYQARFDKVKVISKIVKNAANYEYTTMVDVVKARQIKQDLQKSSEDLSKKINKLESTSKSDESYRNLQNELTKSLNGIDVVFERYPELRATEAYRDFQSQYEGIENRIQKARSDYNKAVKKYNIKVRKFPNNLLSGVFGFERKEGFSADEGTENIDADDIDISLDN